jgi:hypothetical protein
LRIALIGQIDEANATNLASNGAQLLPAQIRVGQERFRQGRLKMTENNQDLGNRIALIENALRIVRAR